MNCKTKYWFRKVVTKLMASTCLGYAYSMPRLCQELTRRLATNEITARRSRAYVSCLTSLRLVVSLLLFLTLGSSSVWGQTKVSDGIYYIRNNNTLSYGYLWPSVTTNTTLGYRYLTTSLATSAEAVDNINGLT